METSADFPDPVSYLDCAATVPMRRGAIEAMLPYLDRWFGNASGSHRVAREARRGLEEARDAVARATGRSPHGVVFTSGGTEADNLAVNGILQARGGRAVCSAVEHHAVLDPVRASGGEVIGVDRHGIIDLEQLADRLDTGVSIVSVMAVNNETGVLQPLEEVAEIVRREAPGAVLHTDAVQAVCWTDFARFTAPADLVSMAGHKFGGPKGVGALLVGEGIDLVPQIRGGGQEQERRSGSSNVAGAVGMAQALVEVDTDREAARRRVARYRDELLGALTALEGVEDTVAGAPRAEGWAHLILHGLETEALLVLLEQGGVMASTASSCASGAVDPSHVLAAMGRDRSEAFGALRLTIGHQTHRHEIDRALEVIPEAVTRLRGTGRR